MRRSALYTPPETVCINEEVAEKLIRLVEMAVQLRECTDAIGRRSMLQEMDRPLGLEALERLPRVFPTKEEALPLLVELRGMAAVSCLPPEERWFVPCPVFPTDQAYLRDEAGERYRVVPGCEWVCRGIGAGRWEPVVAPGVAEEIRIGQGIWRLGTPSWHGEEHISILRPPQPLRANRDTWRPGTTLASFLNDVFGLEKPKENGT